MNRITYQGSKFWLGVSYSFVLGISVSNAISELFTYIDVIDVVIDVEGMLFVNRISPVGNSVTQLEPWRRR